jgi:hypothetical protein
MLAEEAIAIRTTHPRNANASPQRQTRAGALNHLSHNLMARYQWLVEHRQIALQDVQVCSAYAACEHSQQYVAGRHLRARHILNPQMERGAPLSWFEDGSLHKRLSTPLS